MKDEREKVTAQLDTEKNEVTSDEKKGYNPAQIIEGSEPEAQQPQPQQSSDKKSE